MPPATSSHEHSATRRLQQHNFNESIQKGSLVRACCTYDNRLVDPSAVSPDIPHAIKGIVGRRTGRSQRQLLYDYLSTLMKLLRTALSTPTYVKYIEDIYICDMYLHSTGEGHEAALDSRTRIDLNPTVLVCDVYGCFCGM
jgi:hypothetical protein